MVQLKSFICSVPDCGKPGLGRCSQCKVRYCGEACQADDWPSHMRFCLPLPPLEYPESDQADLQIIDINNSTSSGNTVVAGSVSVEMIQSAGDQPTAVTKKDGGTIEKTEKKEEEDTNPPAQVEEVSRLPEEAVVVQPNQQVEDVSPQVEKKDLPKVVLEDSSPTPKVKEAISSPQMAGQEMPAGLQDIDLLEAVQIVSPAEFSISLAAEVRLCLIFPLSSFHHLNLFRVSITSSWSLS